MPPISSKTPSPLTRYASEKFREKAQFSLEEVKEALSRHTDDLIPLEKLVELLQHLNILTVILTSRADGTTERNFFMPCVLRSARASDLSVPLKPSDPAPLMLRYECGYVPMGVFPAMITNLVSQRLEDWQMIFHKNRVKFYVGDDYDTVTLLSHPWFLEILISRNASSEGACGCGVCVCLCPSCHPVYPTHSHLLHEFPLQHAVPVWFRVPHPPRTATPVCATQGR